MRFAIVAACLLSLGITQRDQSAPPTAPPKIGVVSSAGCPLKLQAAHLIDTDSGKVIEYTIANPTDTDLLVLELTLFQYTSQGVLTGRSPILVDPTDLPVAAAQHKTLRLPPIPLGEPDLVRVGISSAAPGFEGCGGHDVEHAADVMFEPADLVTYDADGSPVSIKAAQALPPPPAIPTEVTFTATNVQDAPVTAIFIEAFAFPYSPTGTEGNRVRGAVGIPMSPFELAAGQSRGGMIRIGGLPPLRTGDQKWKIVIMTTQAMVNGQKWEVPRPVIIARTALLSSAPGFASSRLETEK